MSLVGRDFDVRSGGRRILSGVSLEIPRGEITAIIGPNGAGKSTLLRAVAGLVRPAAGEVRAAGVPIGALRARERAQRIAFVAQETGAGADLAVRDLVLLGRYARRSRLGRLRLADQAIADDAIAAVGMSHLADRAIATLSGGERQLVQIARAIAQDAEAVLLDEPTSALDVHHQLRVFAILRRLAGAGSAVAVVLHDLNEASRHADRIAVVAGGRIVADGAPGEVLTERLLADVYRIEARVHPDEAGRPHGRPLRIPEPAVAPARAAAPSPSASAPVP